MASSATSSSWKDRFFPEASPLKLQSFIPIFYADGIVLPPEEVIEEGISFWKDYPAGCIVGDSVAFRVLEDHLERI